MELNLHGALDNILEKALPQRLKHMIALEQKEKEHEMLRQKFNVENFMIADSDCLKEIHVENNSGIQVSEGKIKVRILQLDFQYFNAIDTICQNLKQDNRVDVLMLVDSAVDKGNTELMLKNGYRCCEISKYDIVTDSPNIVIETMTYRNLCYDVSYEKIKKYSDIFVLIPLEIVNYYEREYGIWYWKQALKKIQPDITILDNSMYEFLNKRISGYKLIKMGHAKYDTIYNKLKKGSMEVPKEWTEKLQRRGTILWTTVHGIASDHLSKNVTFHEYAPAILQWFKEHKDCTLIFRTSSGFFTELVYTTGFWSVDDLRRFRTMFAKSSNMILDETSDYAMAFSVSDAIMTEANGILISYLTTKKPIMYLKQEQDKIGFQDKRLIKNYYIGDCPSKVTGYLDMIYEGKDPLYNRRMKTMENYISSFDGENGKRIKDYIIDQYLCKNAEME